MYYKILFEIDSDGAITYTSKSFDHHFGSNTPAYLFELFSPEIPHAVLEHMRDTLHDAKPWRNYVNLKCQIVQQEWADLTIVPSSDHGFSVCLSSTTDGEQLFKTKLTYETLNSLAQSRRSNDHITLENHAFLTEKAV